VDNEVSEIGKLLVHLKEAQWHGDASGAKKLRRTMRNKHGFYISDFDNSRKGFDRSDFEKLIRMGRIVVTGRWIPAMALRCGAPSGTTLPLCRARRAGS